MTTPGKAFAITTAISFAAYFATLSPTVTMYLGGSLVAAADNLGVGNCPGYPLWTMVAWIFCRVFSFVTYHGHPNPAWAVNLMSAVFASLTCGVAAWTVAKICGRMLPAIAAGLLLAACPAMWHYAVVSETVSFYLFFIALLIAASVRYAQTGNEKCLLVMSACFGTVWLCHPGNFPLVFLFPVVLALRDRKLCLAFVVAMIIAVFAWWTTDHFGGRTEYCADFCYIAGILTAVALPQRRMLLAMAGVFLLAHLPWAYLPLASSRNPVENFGVASQWEGFMHMITRGQYEAPNWWAAIRDPAGMPEHMRGCTMTALLHLGWPALLAAVFALWMLREKETRCVILPLLAAAVLTTAGIALLGYFTWDLQSWIMESEWLMPFLLVVAVLAGLGASVVLSRLPSFSFAAPVLLIALLLAEPLRLGWFDEQFALEWGASNHRGNVFAWRFGADILEGSRAIRDDLRPGEKLPDANYPPPMEPDAIYFGGTDPGRFAIEYMIFSAHMRPDVFVITQNALADNTYLLQIRLRYGERIWIPSQQDSNEGFQQYVADIQAGRIPAGADVSFEGGRVQVQGVGGVMAINGILAKQIFEKNKARHPFYVEESYVIPWMYPHLEPCGLIFRMRSEPLKEISPEIVRRDRVFWDWYTRRLMSNPDFLANAYARKTFAKLRSASAGLYIARHMFAEGEYAFKQAIELCPVSPEANFRLADAYMQQFRFGDAERVIERHLRDDPLNTKVAAFLDQIRAVKKTNARREELEKKLSSGGDIDLAMELLHIYHSMNLNPRRDGLADSIVAQTNLPPRYILEIGHLYGEWKRPDRVAAMLGKYLEREPADAERRFSHAEYLTYLNKTNDALAELRRAVGDGGADIRSRATNSSYLAPLRATKEFGEITKPQ